MTLALALWQAAKTRQNLLLATWDSGRVGQQELERLSALIWGRLDTQASSVDQLRSMAVSLPEAGRLCDALVAQLRTRLNTDPTAEQQQIRLRDLRAQLERIRDQVKLEPPTLVPAASAKLATLAARTDDLGDKRTRGGDIGGMLGALEIDAARLERDLIVGAAAPEARDLLARAREQLAELPAREQGGPHPGRPGCRRCGPTPETACRASPRSGRCRTPHALIDYATRSRPTWQPAEHGAGQPHREPRRGGRRRVAQLPALQAKAAGTRLRR